MKSNSSKTPLIKMSHLYMNELIEDLVFSSNYLDFSDGLPKSLLTLDEKRKQLFFGRTAGIPSAELLRFKHCLKDPSVFLLNAILPKQGKILQRLNLAFARVHMFVFSVAISITFSSYLFMSSILDTMSHGYVIGVMFLGFIFTLSLLFPLFVALFSWPILRNNWLSKYLELINYALDQRNTANHLYMDNPFNKHDNRDTAYARTIH